MTIPNSVTSIGNSAFNGCYIQKENIHNKSTIDLSACGLIVCDKRTDSGICVRNNEVIKYFGKESAISIPDGVTTFGAVFRGCLELKSISIPNSVTTIGENAFYGCTGLTSITIPNSVTSIGSGAFHGCSSLTSITIPNSVTCIGGSAFNDCI
ncbi:MAG: leucine-rich repeat domain-containing protein [Bacteroidaceae bacterium]|nr:leucine-rich repeat domain-containing protein [Bacteroidaceae bacterium]